jgi:hypothetical protein
MKRIGLLIALSLLTAPALAEDILETPSNTPGSFHIAHYVGVSGAESRDPSFAVGSSAELRVLFARRAGLAVTLGAEFNDYDTTLFGGIGPRLRLTAPGSALDVTLGYDVRILRLREWDVLNWGPPPEALLTMSHALALRAEGPMSPSGALRVGGYIEAGLAHNGHARWGSLGMSVGFSGRRQ